jgi:Domain of unknown function (DUF4272)
MDHVRVKSLLVTSSLGILVPSHLPELDAAAIRSLDDTANRLLCLNAVAAADYGLPSEKSYKWLESQNLIKHLEPAEEAFLLHGKGSKTVFQWQVEGAFALSWALSLYASMSFDTPCPDDLVHKMPNLKELETIEAFKAKLSLRDSTEIFEAADLAYCLSWAARDSQLIGTSFPKQIQIGVLMERRRALEWLICDESWYEISLDT